MRAGRLCHKITIQESTVSNVGGESTHSWATYKTAWASIHPARGDESWRSDQRFAEVTHEVRMRYQSGITPKMRILWGSRVFDIKYAINVEERDRELRLMCIEDV